MAITKRMQAEFNKGFSRMMDTFMDKYEDQIEDMVEIDILIHEAADEWAYQNGL